MRAVQIFCQHSVTWEETEEGKRLIIEFLEEFEEIYVQRKASRIHFVRQCLHTLWHMAYETRTLGPMCSYAQWTMERVIGYLGQDIRLHSQPFTNLALLGVERASINGLLARYPDLEILPEGKLATRNLDIGDRYTLLRP